VPLGTAVEEVTATMNGLALPPATHWELAGTSQDQVDSFAKLLLGLGLSVVLMYMVLTILYESWLQPILVLSALPLATVGAFLGLLVFGQTLNVPSFIGIIALFGLVGKNAILLVDRTNDLRRHHGLGRTAALEQSGPSRLRPILMTSAVLILSMLPVSLEIGGSGSGRAPLGAVLVGGMFTSTFLSLLYVPVAYTYFDSFGTLMGRLFGWRPGRRVRSETAEAAPVEPVAAEMSPVAVMESASAVTVGSVSASTIVMTPGSSQIIKLLVVDDVPSVRHGLRMRLSLESDLHVVGEAASGEEALAVVRSLQPDVILMDIEMPGLDGLVTTAAMRTVAPQSAVVTLSMHDDTLSREKAMAAGATAFVGKSAASKDLLTAIRDAANSAA
jgi:CheY-like chemotaxis protein